MGIDCAVMDKPLAVLGHGIVLEPKPKLKVILQRLIGPGYFLRLEKKENSNKAKDRAIN